MRKLQTTLGFVLLCFILAAQTPHYFYNHKKERVYLSLNTRYAFLSVSEQVLPANIQQRNIRTTELRSDNTNRKQLQARQGTNRFFTTLSFEETMSDEQYLRLLSDIRNQNENVIVSPFFKINEGDRIGLSNFFYVKLNELADTTLLRQMSERTSTIVIRQDMFMPLWFILSTTEKSELNALENANFFFESGLFHAAEPDFMIDIRLCTNDDFFDQQWGLKNTIPQGEGIDIRACEAWQLSRGNNIIIAIIDEGIELDHPDLQANTNQLLSWDAVRKDSPSEIHGSHGVWVAGVAGAVQNNEIGISGVAPNSQLMSISFVDEDNPFLKEQLAAGINWAWKNGADVINNSWGGGALDGLYIRNAIDSAVTYGRNGLGSVVVGAAGNGAVPSVVFPANLPDVIAVGAMDEFGGRLSNSNFGNNLDVTAPGIRIRTTDRHGTYAESFRNTSAAVPHVSGIAALMLSANPDLTWQQVKNIIERTAQRVRPGANLYEITPGRPNGVWSHFVGYGLVNAREAVQTAICTTIFGNTLAPPHNHLPLTVITNTTVIGCSGLFVQNVVVRGNATTLWLEAQNGISIRELIIESGARVIIDTEEDVNLSDVVVRSGAKLVINAGGDVIFDGNFEIMEGAELEIK